MRGGTGGGIITVLWRYLGHGCYIQSREHYCRAHGGCSRTFQVHFFPLLFGCRGKWSGFRLMCSKLCQRPHPVEPFGVGGVRLFEEGVDITLLIQCLHSLFVSEDVLQLIRVVLVCGTSK